MYVCVQACVCVFSVHRHPTHPTPVFWLTNTVNYFSVLPLYSISTNVSLAIKCFVYRKALSPHVNPLHDESARAGTTFRLLAWNCMEHSRTKYMALKKWTCSRIELNHLETVTTFFKTKMRLCYKRVCHIVIIVFLSQQWLLSSSPWHNDTMN